MKFEGKISADDVLKSVPQNIVAHLFGKFASVVGLMNFLMYLRSIYFMCNLTVAQRWRDEIMT
jgi:hypothetical protein